jgi:hypothetical protein
MNLKAQGGIKLVTEQHESGAPVATISQYADLIFLKHRSHQFFKASLGVVPSFDSTDAR